MAVKISQQIHDGIEFARTTGKYNMLDVDGVIRVCFDNNYYETVDWIVENRSLYVRMVFEGIEIVDPELVDREEE